MLTSQEKQQRLIELANNRKAARLNGYACLRDFHGGIYECDYVSPWTKSVNNVDADVMVSKCSSHQTQAREPVVGTAMPIKTIQLPTMIALTLLATLGWCSSSGSAQEDSAVLGPGVSSCAQFAKGYRDDPVG